MNLYLLSQEENTNYDTYDSAVVAAESEEIARTIHPDGPRGWDTTWPTWASSPSQVEVVLLGVAKEKTEQGVILASFNAG